MEENEEILPCEATWVKLEDIMLNCNIMPGAKGQILTCSI